MDRCRECNSTLQKSEITCWACGAAVRRKEPGSSPAARIATVAKCLFFPSAILTVASMFIHNTPPFPTCLVLTVVLLLVKSSANQMLEKTKD
ncbi:MAG: hypothetical protein ACRD30_00385 [Bryobacteraceae bacterium]